MAGGERSASAKPEQLPLVIDCLDGTTAALGSFIAGRLFDQRDLFGRPSSLP